jgi:hypothetical protein
MSNFKSINGYKVADGDLRNCVAFGYDQSNAYDAGDIVLYNNAMYKAKYDIPAGTPWSLTYWGRTHVGRELENLTRDFEGIHFPNGNANVPIMRLDQHAGETLQLVNKRGFYLLKLQPTGTNWGALALWQNGIHVYNFASRNGDMVSNVIYLNTGSYEIVKGGTMEFCELYN